VDGKAMIKKIQRILVIYATAASFITFSLFIMEEAIQTTMFGVWPAQDAQAWAQVEKNLTLMENINACLKITNMTIGWIQPLAFLSYLQYSKATSEYIQSNRHQIVTIRPQIYHGKVLNLELSHQRTTKCKTVDGRKFK
jgi:hypothetical protein